MPSRGRLSVVFGGPQSSALIGATDKWTLLSGTSTRLGEKQRWVCSCVVFQSENWWILSPCFGEQTRSFPPKSMGILHLPLFHLSKAQPGFCLPIPSRRHKGQIQSCQELPAEILHSTFSRFRSWSRWLNLCLREISAAGSGPHTCVHVHMCVQVFPQEAALTNSGGVVLSSAVKRSIPNVSPKTRKDHFQHPTKAFSWKLWNDKDQVPMSLRV